MFFSNFKNNFIEDSNNINSKIFFSENENIYLFLIDNYNIINEKNNLIKFNIFFENFNEKNYKLEKINVNNFIFINKNDLPILKITKIISKNIENNILNYEVLCKLLRGNINNFKFTNENEKIYKNSFGKIINDLQNINEYDDKILPNNLNTQILIDKLNSYIEIIFKWEDPTHHKIHKKWIVKWKNNSETNFNYSKILNENYYKINNIEYPNLVLNEEYIWAVCAILSDDNKHYTKFSNYKKFNLY